MRSPFLRRDVLSWAFYDWANSAFATTVMAGFFPLFFKSYWSAGTDATVSTFWLGMGNGAASFVVALLAPFLGAVADRGGTRVRLLLLFTVLGVVLTAGLYWVGKGEWQVALACYALAVIGFSGGSAFCDSLLLDVATEPEFDRVSAYGYALGYLGGGLLFLLNVLMFLKPALFGLADGVAAVRAAFLTVAVWWAVFTLPLLLFVRERSPGVRLSAWQAVSAGWRELGTTIGHVRAYRHVVLFLIAYWLYIDGVNTVIKMAVDYGMALGFPQGSLITALLITQFVGLPATMGFGWIGDRFGARTGIMISIAVYFATTLWAYFLDNVLEFYAMAIVIGLVQGGIQSLSRSFYGRLVPAEKSGEFFGFFNMMGKFAAVLGPLLVGWMALLTGSSRIAILSLVVFFAIGWVLLALIRVPTSQDRAGSSL